MADAPAALRAQQMALARHLRDPAAVPPPGGIEDRRLAIYRDLLHNNIRRLLSGNFPVIRRTLGDDAWASLVRRFFAGHRCHTPLFTEIGREFQRWLEQQAGQDPDLPAWLPELAHYEWVELALQISDAQPPCAIDPLQDHADRAGALLDGVPVVSPQAWALAYRWPVHRIAPGYQPRMPPDEPTLLLVRRDHDGQVRFASLSPLAFRLLELLAPARDSGRAMLRALAAEAGAEADALLPDGGAMLVRMLDEGTLAGIRARQE